MQQGRLRNPPPIVQDKAQRWPQKILALWPSFRRRVSHGAAETQNQRRSSARGYHPHRKKKLDEEHKGGLGWGCF